MTTLLCVLCCVPCVGTSTASCDEAAHGGHGQPAARPRWPSLRASIRGIGRGALACPPVDTRPALCALIRWSRERRLRNPPETARTGGISQRRQMICLSSRTITRPRPMDTGVVAPSEYPQAGGGCSREETKAVSEDEEVVALMPSG